MSFAEDIKRFQTRTEARASGIARKVILDLHSRVVERMPHDTGRAMANTQVALNSQPSGATDDTDDKKGTKVRAQAEALMTSFVLGDTGIVFNNVEYICPLEFDFHSPQAPAGMFRVSVQDILQAWPNIVQAVAK